MAVVEELLKAEEEVISFGNHELAAKAKKEDYEFQGDLYKVKTYCEITKLEKNGRLVYESVPGTSVNAFQQTASGVSFLVEGKDSAQITLELEDDTEYKVSIDGKESGSMMSNLSGKLNLNVSFDGAPVKVEVSK